MAAPSVRIVVLNWNKPRETATCLDSLLRQDYPNAAITLVDNASREDPRTVFAGYLGRVALIGTTENLGYTGGNNLAIARALAEGADYVWLVNNDAVAAPDCLRKLVAAAEADPAIGLAGPVIRRHAAPAEIELCGGVVAAAACRFEWFDRLEPARAAQTAAPASFMLPGTALLVRGAVWRRIGLFDVRMFAYHEDIDLALRSARAGFRAVLVEDAVVGHDKDPGGRTPPHVVYYSQRNEIRLWRTHAPLRSRLRRALWDLDTLTRPTAAADPAHRQARLAGYWHGMLGRTGMYSPDHAMPWPLRALLAARPRLVRALLRLA